MNVRGLRAYRDIVLASAPVAYWRLGEASVSDPAVDAAGGGHTGTYNAGVTLGQPGAFPNEPAATSALFGGSPDEVVVADADDLSFPYPGVITIEFWLKVTDEDSAAGVMSKVDDTVPAFEWAVQIVGGLLYLQAFHPDGSVVSSQAVSLPTDDDWHHWVWVGTGAAFLVYRDGEWITSDVGPSGFMSNTTAPVKLGRYRDTFFNGQLQDVAIYDHALTKAEARLHYRVGTRALDPSFPSESSLYAQEVIADKPVAYWRLGEASVVDPAVDEIGRFPGSYEGAIVPGEPGLLNGDTDTAARLAGTAAADHVLVPTNALLTFPAMSVEAWAQRDRTGVESNGGLVNKTPTYNLGFAEHEFQLGQRIQAQVRVDESGGSPSFETRTVLHEVFARDALGDPAWNTRMHLVMTYDPVAGRLSLFVNGVLGAITDDIPAPIVADTADLLIGKGASASDLDLESLFGGVVDEVAVYDYVLHQSRIVAHYEAGIVSAGASAGALFNGGIE